MGHVSGKVTHQGKPVPFAAVEFHPIGDGKSSLGWTDEQGDYEAMYTLSQKGVLLGNNKVSVRTYADDGQTAVPVPEKFSGNNGMEIEVKPGSNHFDIEL